MPEDKKEAVGYAIARYSNSPFLSQIIRQALRHLAVKPRDRLSADHRIENRFLRGLRHGAEGKFQRLLSKYIVRQHAVLAAVRHAIGGRKADHDIAGTVTIIRSHARKTHAAALENPAQLPHKFCF